MYAVIRSLLFCFPAETSHSLALKALGLIHRLGLSGLFRARYQPGKSVRLMGLDFDSPVGLAAGLDKNGDYIDALAAIGFGFIEIGTLTPRPQPGNPRPRLFRLRKEQAIINRMGFNNKGIDYAIEQLQKIRFRGVLGINIGKNADTPVENAADDYLIGLRKAWPYASYIVVNLSSPNTPGLRSLQFGQPLRDLLAVLKAEQNSLTQTSGKRVPLVIKIAPDLEEAELDMLAQTLLEAEVDAVAATNTTLSRAGVEDNPLHREAGGLSGRPLQQAATDIIGGLHERLQGQIPIIGIGGISSAADARAKLDAGASLLQVYSGFIYQGPDLLTDIYRELSR